MTGAVPVPARGQPMKASWAAAVSERVNSLCAMAPANMLARDGFGGMGAQPLPANLRERVTAATLPGCWRLKFSAGDDDGEDDDEGSSGEETTALKLVECWYNVGGVTKLAEDIDVTSLLSGSGGGDSRPSGFLCAVFGNASPTAMLYADRAALSGAQEDESRYVVPLYKIQNGSAVLDLRGAPQIQVFEGTL